MITESADGVRLGRTLESKLRILDNLLNWMNILQRRLLTIRNKKQYTQLGTVLYVNIARVRIGKKSFCGEKIIVKNISQQCHVIAKKKKKSSTKPSILKDNLYFYISIYG